jgi:endonuclease I
VQKPIHRLLIAATVLSATLSACSPNSQQLPAAFRNQTGVQSQSTLNRQATSPRTDWYAALPAALKQYYAPAQGKTGRDLLLALNKILATGYVSTEYGPAKSFLYASADHITQGNISGVFDSYSYMLIPGNGGDGNTYKEQGDNNQDGTANDFINLEHTWPQSFFNKVPPMVSDMHHMFPTLSKPNAMRSNFPIGNVEGTVVYTTNGGSKLSALDKTGRHSAAETTQLFNLPWEKQPHQIIDNDFKVTFEPLDRQKGNTARALLYFYVRYFNANIRQGAYDEVNFWDSKVATYIQWAQLDAPDELEVRRHEAIAQKQHNRNPFIDIPGLAQLITADVLINNTSAASTAPGVRNVSSQSLTRPD